MAGQVGVESCVVATGSILTRHPAGATDTVSVKGVAQPRGCCGVLGGFVWFLCFLFFFWVLFWRFDSFFVFASSWFPFAAPYPPLAHILFPGMAFSGCFFFFPTGF